MSWSFGWARNKILEYFRKKAENNGLVRTTETGPWNYHNKKTHLTRIQTELVVIHATILFACNVFTLLVSQNFHSRCLFPIVQVAHALAIFFPVLETIQPWCRQKQIFFVCNFFGKIHCSSISNLRDQEHLGIIQT